MGNETSKNAMFVECSELFSDGEQSNMSQIYSQICDNHKDGFSQTDLLKYGLQYLVEPLLAKLFAYMKSVLPHSPGDKDNDLLVSDEEFLIALAFILKGSLEQKAGLLMYLSTGAVRGSITTNQLKQTLEQLLESFKQRQQADAQSNLNTWKFSSGSYSDNLSQFLLHDLNYKGQKKQCDVEGPFPSDAAHTTDSVQTWLSQSPLTLGLLDDVFHRMFSVSAVDAMIHQNHLVPRCDNVPWDKFRTLLDLPSLMFLNQQLPSELKNTWRPLYSSGLHGESFSTMVKDILDKGPTLLLVEDTDGHVFGGFASVSWKYTSQFIGTNRSFLFSLSPLMDVYQTTAYNENYQYLNHGQETIPNGLGMGGQLDYFGLWLDAEFGRGHSKAGPRCTTFDSCQLSKHEDFTIRTLEIWGVGPELKRDSAEGMDDGSILDKDPEAKAMLSLLNRGPISDGLREKDPMADIPGELSLEDAS